MTLNDQGQSKITTSNLNAFVNTAYVHDESGSETVFRRKSGNSHGLQLESNAAQPPNHNNNNVVNATFQSLDFDDLLPMIGEFGKYQKILFLCMIPFTFFVAFVYFSQIFLTLIPEQHWCTVPELDGLPTEER